MGGRGRGWVEELQIGACQEYVLEGWDIYIGIST